MNDLKSELEQYLLEDLSAESIKALRQSGKVDAELVDAIWQILMSNKHPLSWRAAWLLYHLTYDNKELMRPYISEILAKLAQLPHPGQRRELLKVLMFFEPQEMDMGILFNLSYSLFTNPDESLANIVHSMQILYNISQIETELKPELLSTIELMLPQSKAGFKSRGGKLAKKLRKQIG